MKYELTGTVFKIGDIQEFPSGFRKRDFVIETDDEKYPQEIKMEAVKEKCEVLDAYSIGDPITVSFNIRGNEYKGKHYVSLAAWKFDRSAGQAKPAPRQPEPPAIEDTTDEIPF